MQAPALQHRRPFLHHQGVAGQSRPQSRRIPLHPVSVRHVQARQQGRSEGGGRSAVAGDLMHAKAKSALDERLVEVVMAERQAVRDGVALVQGRRVAAVEPLDSSDPPTEFGQGVGSRHHAIRSCYVLIHPKPAIESTD